jgi:hypothetical protein
MPFVVLIVGVAMWHDTAMVPVCNDADFSFVRFQP